MTPPVPNLFHLLSLGRLGSVVLLSGYLSLWGGARSWGAAGTWQGGLSGNWSDNANWTGASFPTSGQLATFDQATGQNATITLNATAAANLQQKGAGTITISGTNGFTLNGASAIAFGASGGGATTSGDLIFTAPLTLANNFTINQVEDADTAGILDFASAMTNTGDSVKTMTVAGKFDGAIRFSGGYSQGVGGFRVFFGTTATAGENKYFEANTDTVSIERVQVNNSGGSYGNVVFRAIGSERTFSGSSTIGTIILNGASGVSNTTELEFGGSQNLTIATTSTNVFSFNNLVPTGGGALSFNQSNSGSTTLSGNIVLSGSSNAGITQLNLIGSGSGDLRLGAIIQGNATASAITVNRTAGTVTRFQGASTYTGTTTLQSGIAELGIANGLGSTGTISFTGGVLRYGTGITQDVSGRISSAASQAYKIDTNGESVTWGSALTSSGGSLAKSGSGNLTLSSSNSYTGATEITGGALVVSTLANGGANSGIGASTNAAANLILNGGTLRYTGATATTDRSFTIGTAGGGIEASGSGAITIGGSVELAGSNTARTFVLGGSSTGLNTLSGNLANNGSGATSLTKEGAGTWILGGTNTHSGATLVNGGTLVLNGSSTSSALTVASGATLSGTGTAGAITIQNGGILSPGGAPGTLTAGNVVWNGGGNYNWQLQDATAGAGTGWDFLSSSGTLDLTSITSTPFNLNLWTINATGGSAAPSNFTNTNSYSWDIASFSNVLGFSSEKFQIVTSASQGTQGFLGGAVGATYSLALTGGNTTLTLSYTPPSASAVWTAGSGNWSTGANWQSGSAPTSSVPVEFSGAGGVSTNDAQLASVVGLTFTASAGGAYTINGSALQVAAGGVANSSSYSQTVASDLTLAASQVWKATGGNLTFTGAVDTNGQALTINGTHTTLVSGSLSGGGSLTKTDSGTLIFSADQGYSGTTTITAGTLQIGDGGTTGGLSASSAITNNGVLSFKRSNTVTQGTDFATTIGGSGAVRQDGTGTLVLSGSNSYSGGTTLATGTLAVNNANALGSGSLTISGGTLANTSGAAVTLATANSQSWNADITFVGPNDLNLGTGAVTLGANRTVTVSGATLGISGAISGSGLGLTKSGNGTLSLAGTNTFNGSTVVNEGSLQLNGNGTLASSSVITVASGATLALAGGGTYSNNFTVSGTGSGGLGAIRNISGNNSLSTANSTLSGDTTLRSDSGTLTITFVSGAFLKGGNSNLTVSGAGNVFIDRRIDIGTGQLIKEGSGTLRLGAFNAYSGNTTVQEGTLLVFGNDRLSDNSRHILNGGTLDYSTYNDTISGLILNGGSLSSTTGVLTSSTGYDLQSGTIGGKLGVGNLTVSTGIVATSGAGRFHTSSNLTISSGQLTLGGAESVARFVQDGGTLAGSGSISSASDFEVRSGTASASLAGSSGLVKSTAGTFTLSGSNSYSGNTTIQSGTLEAVATNALQSSANIIVSSGGSLLVTASNVSSNQTDLFFSSASSTALTLSGNSTNAFGLLTLTENSSIDFGSGSVTLAFAEIAGLTTHTLSIYNWSGGRLWGGGDSKDHLYVTTSLDAGELSRISFYSGLQGSAFLGTGYEFIGSPNEIIAVPEPSVVICAALLLAAGVFSIIKKTQLDKFNQHIDYYSLPL